MTTVTMVTICTKSEITDIKNYEKNIEGKV